MNEHDSEKVAGVLLARGYRQVDTVEAANVILYNTCSIREKAAQKVYSRLGEFREVDGVVEKAPLRVGANGRQYKGEENGFNAEAQRRRAEVAEEKENGWQLRQEEAVPQGLKPGFAHDVMSDVKVRPPVPAMHRLGDSPYRSKDRPIHEERETQDPASKGEDGAPAEATTQEALADSLYRSKDRPLHEQPQEGGVKPPLLERFKGVAGEERPASEGAPYKRAEGRGKIIGVLGCLAQQEGERIFARAPWVSLVCGSASYRKLPQLIQELEAGNRRVTGLDTDTDETFETEMTRRDNPWRAYLTIIEGCDKACSYCVVPFTRGPERSRASASILEEVRKLAETGYTEVQLLGQTVNSYADPSGRKMRFSDLLVAVAEVRGIRRVRFTTSHPRDFGKDIVEAIEAVPAICEHVHLPVQSGSTKVLKAMARTYTRDDYLEKIAMMRAAKREISITSDIIVGFPGETEKDFEETLSLLDAAQYDGAFSFKYSPRPNTVSLKMDDAIPEDEKSRRLAILMERQREIQRARNERLVGKSFEVMVEGKSRRENPSGVRAGQWSGHTSSNKVMNFTSREEESLGDYVQVKVVGATPNSLVGEVDRTES
jgi:tRNA-2-methylthio-N6-dimethylallyladenosine synthase